ncbi:AAEL006448-PA [Aedes aegypti]|uniref:AAEL006448-PA n=1 Tax=Aedes aegypti TaxID=7159 RepID=Q176D7_AEDAE|nr:AAEL006448-PA [Aedes aegypti]
MTPIEDAFQAGDSQLAHDLFMSEWNRVGDSAQIYYQVIRDGLVATFRHLESAGLCQEWDSFCYCSNALLELDVKNVTISKEMELLVMYKLSSYGLKNLCGDSVTVKPENEWLNSIDLIVRWVRELRSRPRWYDFLDVDDQVMFRMRMIHNHLVFIKDKPALRSLPLKEMVFCLAIFVSIHDDIVMHDVYRVMINKRNVMQFLLAVVFRLIQLKSAAQFETHGKSHVLKKLRKTYRRVKQIYSVAKVLSCVQIYREIEDKDFRRCNAPITVAAIKRFNQICGEAIKNTANTSNMSKKLTDLLPSILTDSIMLNSKYRDFSSHGIPLSYLFVRDCDQIFYYKSLRNFIRLAAVSFYAICIYLLYDCTRYMYGMMRRCRSIDDLRALIRYAGGNTIRSLQEDMFARIEKYLSVVNKELNTTNPDDLTTHLKKEFEDLLENYACKVKNIEELRHSHRNFVIDTAEVMAFTNTSISAIHRFLDSKMTDTSSGSYFDTMFTDWKILSTQSLGNAEFDAVVVQSYIHKHLELDHGTTEQWRYSDRTKQIINHFTSDTDLDASTCETLEEKLHRSLSQARKGYYHNIFDLRLKVKTITKVLQPFIVGSSASTDFFSNTNKFQFKLDALRQQDERELNLAFQKLILNLQQIFLRRDCNTIEMLIKNQQNILLKERLAIEYWQMQALEMLNSSGYFGDNFSLLTRSVPMIWGKSYRNCLAHDSLSYDLLTNSGTFKQLINAFVLAFHSSELNIFTQSPKYTLDGLVIPETKSIYWLELQGNLLNFLHSKSFDFLKFNACLEQGAELSGRYLMPLGQLLRARYYSMPVIFSHEQFDEYHNRMVAALLSLQFPEIDEALIDSKVEHAIKLNLLLLEIDFSVEEAIQQFSALQPQLMTPCIGAIIPHLVYVDNFKLLKTLLERYTGSDPASLLLMSSCRTELERDFIYTHLDYRFNIISELTEHDVNILFTEKYPASEYHLGLTIIRYDLRLFKHIVQKCYQTKASVILESDLREAMETCCWHGRLEMVHLLLGKLKFDALMISHLMTSAIIRHHWKIFVLLYEKCMDVWMDDGINVLSMILERNFRILKRILIRNPISTASIPNDLKENLVICSVRNGSERLLEYFDRIYVDILNVDGVLTAAAMNKDAEILEYVESRLFQSEEQLPCFKGLRLWVKLLHELKTLMIITIDSKFMSIIASKRDILRRWVDRLAQLLKIKGDHFADSFHFSDLTKSFCLVLSDDQQSAYEGQFQETVQMCDTFIQVIRSLKQEPIVSKITVSIEVCSRCEQIDAKVDLTIYSSAEQLLQADDDTKINTPDTNHIADSISIGLKGYLSKFQCLMAATAVITINDNARPKQFFYLQIDSSSCIVQPSSQNQFLVYLLNRPNQYSILHYIRSNLSPRTVETLLRLGANPSLPDNRLRTPFRTALAQPCPVEFIQLMYQYCDKFRYTRSHVFNFKDLDGYTPLHGAVATNNYEAVKFLLENGADPAQADQTGEAAVLCYAILNRNVRVVELLLCHSPLLAREFGNTEQQKKALETAVKINHDHIVRSLLAHGADLLHRNREQCTAMKYAIEQEAVESLEVMLEYALRNELIVEDDVDGLGNSALRVAVESGACMEIWRLLICYSMKRRLIDLKILRNKYGL